MQEAIEKNLSLLAERDNLSVADARIVTAGLRPNPVLSIGGDHLDLLGTGFNASNADGPLAELQFNNAVIQAQARLRIARQRLQLLMGRTLPSDAFEVSGARLRALEAEVRNELATA